MRDKMGHQQNLKNSHWQHHFEWWRLPQNISQFYPSKYGLKDAQELIDLVDCFGWDHYRGHGTVVRILEMDEAVGVIASEGKRWKTKFVTAVWRHGVPITVHPGVPDG